METKQPQELRLAMRGDHVLSTLNGSQQSTAAESQEVVKCEACNGSGQLCRTAQDGSKSNSEKDLYE